MTTATTAATPKKGSWLTWLLIGAGTLIGLFLLVGLTYHEKPPAERIRASCQREYPYDTLAEANCEITLSAKYLDQQQAGQLQDAARGAGL